MPILRTRSRTLVSDDGNGVLTYLGALRRACDGHTIRQDAANFLRASAHLPENLAVFACADGFSLVTDDDGKPLAWYPSYEESEARPLKSTSLSPNG